MAKAKKKVSSALDFGVAFKYPFNRWKGLLNILWVFLPIFGWFALGGYGVRIVKGFVGGRFDMLPEIKFGDDMKLGFFMFLKALPFIVAYIIVDSILNFIPAIGWLASLFISIFVIPILGVNFMMKETIGSFFEFDLINVVFANFGEYVVMALKGIGLFLIYLVMCIVLVGFPALAFTQNIFIADFYRRFVGK